MTTSSISPQEAARELLRRRMARASAVDFALAIDVPGRPVEEDEDSDAARYQILNNNLLAKHHRLILTKLEETSKKRHGRMMIFCPPGSAKSSYASIVFPSRFLGEAPDRRIILASYGDDLARKMGRRTRSIIRQEKYQSIYSVTLASDSQAAQEWALSNGSEYMSCGIRAGITGNRAHGIVIDDPIKGREQADSELIRQSTWDAYQDDLMTRLIPGGWICIIQTRWHPDDLSGRILPESWAGESGPILCRDGNVWEVVCLQALCETEGDPLGRKPGEYLWPEWFDEKHWQQFQQNPRTWSALYQQVPTLGGGMEFKREWVNYYGNAVNHLTMGRVMLVDPASGRRPQGNDYTSIWVVGVGQDDNYYVLDMVRDRLNLTERAEAVFRLHRKWKPQQVRYEQYGMMADIEYIRGEMERRSYRFRIDEVGGSTKKEDRIRRLVPLFQRGRMWFPVSKPYTDKQGQLHDLVAEFVDHEMLTFPVGRHDDMLDALARIAEPDLVLPYPGGDEWPGMGKMPAMDFQPTVSSMGY